MLVRKTSGASAALIKELMRRSAQFLLEAGDQNLRSSHVDAALEEMLFQGGSLNAKLLGGAGIFISVGAEKTPSQRSGIRYALDVL